MPDGAIYDLFEDAGVPMFIVDVRANNQFALSRLNKIYTETVGVTVHETCNRPLEDVFAPRLAASLAENYSKCVSGRRTVSYLELLNFADSARWWNTTLTPIFDTKGAVAQIHGICIDITEQTNELFETRLQLDVKAARADEMLELLGTVSHDLRAPLSTIRMALDHTLRGIIDLGDGRVKMLGKISSSVDKTICLTDDILTYFKAIDIDGTVTEQTIDVGHLCREIFALVDPLEELSLGYDDCFVTADKFAVAMILRNLISNAARYATSAASVTVSGGPDGFIEIVVRDDGPGFKNPPTMEATTDQIIRNHGYGLAAVHRTVTRLGGTMTFGKSVQLGGSAVRTRIPGCRLEEQSKRFG